MARWRLAQSLAVLRLEFDAAWPNRNTASDGTIGDPAHAARASRHNPNRYGVVCALDITHDPDRGVDVHALARAHVAAGPHPELAYIVSDRQIASRQYGWRWRDYAGSNPHTSHAHFAVGVGPDRDPQPPYDSTRPWNIATTEAWMPRNLIYESHRTPEHGLAEQLLRAAYKGQADGWSITHDAAEAQAAHDSGSTVVYEVGGTEDVDGAIVVRGATGLETAIELARILGQ